MGKHLPYEKRTGKILRSTFWDVVDDETVRPDKELPPDQVEDFERFLEQNAEYDIVQGIPENSVSGFMRFCEFCYHANDYFRDEPIPLSPMEQYRRMAARWKFLSAQENSTALYAVE